MRVNPDRQTLILAGEMPPGRSAAVSSAAGSGGHSLVANRTGAATQHVIPTRFDTVTDAEFSDAAPALPAATARPSPGLATRELSFGSAYGSSFGFAYGASAYARTQAPPVRRHPLIDTYAKCAVQTGAG